MNTLQKFEAKQLAERTAASAIPDFGAGSTLSINGGQHMY